MKCNAHCMMKFVFTLNYIIHCWSKRINDLMILIILEIFSVLFRINIYYTYV